jgi:two-component system sensor histidine kinase DevS
MGGRSLRRADFAALLALLMLLCWVFPFSLLLWLAGTGIDDRPDLDPDLRTWLWAGLASGALVGCWLALQARRAWVWRRRRNPRPSREIQAERQRLARALHDAVGSQLVSASMLLDRDDPRQRQLHEALDQCLLDLRLLVDTMDYENSLLTDRLATLRHRLGPVIERRAIALQWEAPDVPLAGLPTGEAAQHICAIVQEAVSNALQHAQATALHVTLEQLGGRWHLRIEDNGVGMASAPGTRPAGNGLQGMVYRAARVGAQLERGTGLHGKGVCVHVHWPVPPQR